ncbi:hypothetical protein OH807_02255 [Kitasatospora sp. NBC_01560]|uniref:hypothetical protein n=1 Tax=Kitasatospora sp. NBC_01560 TaxID=2975965 RepID=UPI003865A3C7
MPTENPPPPPPRPSLPTAFTVRWAGRCDHHSLAVERELQWWGHCFPDGPPDAEDALILLRRTIGEVRASGLDLRAHTADLLEHAVGPLDAAGKFTRHTITPAILPLVAHHLRSAATALADTRAHLTDNAPATGPFRPPPRPDGEPRPATGTP